MIIDENLLQDSELFNKLNTERQFSQNGVLHWSIAISGFESGVEWFTDLYIGDAVYEQLGQPIEFWDQREYRRKGTNNIGQVYKKDIKRKVVLPVIK